MTWKVFEHKESSAHAVVVRPNGSQDIVKVETQPYWTVENLDTGDFVDDNAHVMHGVTERKPLRYFFRDSAIEAAYKLNLKDCGNA